jgi:putative peptidoglycan lipid II flippase
VAATNIVVAVVLVRATDAEHTAPALVLAYTASYVVGSAISYLVLRRSLARGGGGLSTPTTVRFLVRLLVATGIAGFASWGVATVLPGHDDPSHLLALLRLVLVGGADVLVFLVLARLMRLTEVNEVIDTVTRRLRRPSRTP